MSQSTSTRRRRVSTVSFVAMVLAIVGVGLGAVMVITTSIGAQSRELTALQREAEELAFESASLRTELEARSSTASLALRAANLGLVPNPYPAYVMLGSGKVVGKPTRVRGNEFPQLRGQLPAPSPTPQPTALPSPTPPPVQSVDTHSDGGPVDVVAAGGPGAQPTGQPDARASVQPEPAAQVSPKPQPEAPTTPVPSPAPQPTAAADNPQQTTRTEQTNG